MNLFFLGGGKCVSVCKACSKLGGGGGGGGGGGILILDLLLDAIW